MTEAVIQRFWAKVVKSGPDSCWMWMGSRHTFGHGRACVGRRQSMLAHRLSYILSFGEIPDGVCVLHRCDNPPCVNPAHLFLGDRGDNARDMAAKGRQHLQVNPGSICGDRHWSRRRPELVVRGERHGMARLTDIQVREIRQAVASGATRVSMARKFGACQSTIANIVTGAYRNDAGGPLAGRGRGGRKKGA